MCGSDTFAIEVSSTSMNVARVTVSAITQGLIVPSGILSLDRILSLISFCSSSGSFCAFIQPTTVLLPCFIPAYCVITVASTFIPGRSTACSDGIDRKSTRLNSSHGYISYAVFCLKKKNERSTQLLCAVQ